MAFYRAKPKYNGEQTEWEEPQNKGVEWGEEKKGRRKQSDTGGAWKRYGKPAGKYPAREEKRWQPVQGARNAPENEEPPTACPPAENYVGYFPQAAQYDAIAKQYRGAKQDDKTVAKPEAIQEKQQPKQMVDGPYRPQKAKAEDPVVAKTCDANVSELPAQQDTSLKQLSEMSLNDGDAENEEAETDVYFLKLPPGIEYETWLSMRMRESVFELRMLINMMFRRKTKYRKHFEFDAISICSKETCPIMRAGEFHSYSWSDGLPGSRSEKVAAPTYIAKFLDYARILLSDCYLFSTTYDACVRPDEELKHDTSHPSTVGVGWNASKKKWDACRAKWGKYWQCEWESEDDEEVDTTAGDAASSAQDPGRHAAEFDHYLKQMMRRLYRIYCHIIRHHAYQLEVCNIYETMLKGFKQVLLTVLLFDLLPEIELSALSPFVEQGRQLIRSADLKMESMTTGERTMWKQVVESKTREARQHMADRASGPDNVKKQKKQYRVAYHAGQKQCQKTPVREKRDGPNASDEQSRSLSPFQYQ